MLIQLPINGNVLLSGIPRQQTHCFTQHVPDTYLLFFEGLLFEESTNVVHDLVGSSSIPDDSVN